MSCEKLLSIVIANYNYGHFLEEAISSVLKQDGAELVELIICDAGSTDDSVSIIHKYSQYLTWWCSERDAGQSDAFNKGFKHASGKYLSWLNADDLLLPGTIRALQRADQKHKDASWFTGNVIRFLDSDRRIVSAPWGPHWLPAILQNRHVPLQIFGPTVFLRREVYFKVGLFDVNLHLAMDTEYWWRLTLLGYKQHRINHDCWAFRMHQGSKTAIFSLMDSESKKRVAAIRADNPDTELSHVLKKYDIGRLFVGRCLVLGLRAVDFSLAKAVLRYFFLRGKRVDVS